MARMASTLRHLGHLAPSYSRLDGVALARTPVDHVITFAWIGACPQERVPALLRTSFKSLLAKDRRARERGVPFLADGPRERLRAYTREVNREMPKLPRLSREADAAWRERVASLPDSLHIVDFEGLYDQIYDQYAEFDHPSTLGLQVFVHLGGSPVRATVDGQPERNLVEDLRPYWIAVFAFAEALVVSTWRRGTRGSDRWLASGARPTSGSPPQTSMAEPKPQHQRTRAAAARSRRPGAATRGRRGAR
jgi:hypothetical protein